MQWYRRRLIWGLGCLAVAGTVAWVALRGGSSGDPRAAVAKGDQGSSPAAEVGATQVAASAAPARQTGSSLRFRGLASSHASGPLPAVEGGTMLGRGSGFLPS